LRTDSWKRCYEQIVTTLITSSPGVTVAELAGLTGMMSDDVTDVIDRLLARGLIERDQHRRDAFSA
jgi:DNA-binding MarR family transcriptional regulator